MAFFMSRRCLRLFRGQAGNNKKRGQKERPRFLLLPIAVAMRPDRRSGPKPGAVGRH